MNTKEQIRTGIIGIGNWGRYGHLPVLQLLPEFRIQAVSSRRETYGREIAGQFDVPLVFTNPLDLIKHPQIDLVVVLPPAPEHAGLVRAAIDAGKDVYCEWPLTTTVADTEDLLARAKMAKVHHIVGLQRRMGPSARYVRDLVAGGYVGAIRSVRMHVSMNSFQAQRPEGLEWTIPEGNFSHILSIYGGHFLDMLFQMVGRPATVSAEVVNQFPEITIAETGEKFPNTTPDQVLLFGRLENGGVYSIQIEGGKRNGSGLQIDITGMQGDLRICNRLSFQNPGDNLVEGAQGNGEKLQPLTIPSRYSDRLPASKLDASVLDLAYLYAAHTTDRAAGTQTASSFADALWMHRLIEVIVRASSTGFRQSLTSKATHISP